MKKVLISLLVAFLFVGCSSTSALKDGTYKAEMKAPDSHGWTEFVDVTVTNSKITKVVFDAKNEDGALKSQDAEYEKIMKDSGSKTWPSDFYTKLANQLVEKQNINDVEAVAGATTSSDSFKKLVKALSKNMEKGETDTLSVE
ncbi:MAG: FMN-binding protein [Oscillospiraceae bacterium]